MNDELKEFLDPDNILTLEPDKKTGLIKVDISLNGKCLADIRKQIDDNIEDEILTVEELVEYRSWLFPDSHDQDLFLSKKIKKELNRRQLRDKGYHWINGKGFVCKCGVSIKKRKTKLIDTKSQYCSISYVYHKKCECGNLFPKINREEVYVY